jgi:hypothetical protein
MSHKKQGVIYFLFLSAVLAHVATVGPLHALAHRALHRSRTIVG